MKIKKLSKKKYRSIGRVPRMETQTTNVVKGTTKKGHLELIRFRM